MIGKSKGQGEKCGRWIHEARSWKHGTSGDVQIVNGMSPAVAINDTGVGVFRHSSRTHVVVFTYQVR